MSFAPRRKRWSTKKPSERRPVWWHFSDAELRTVAEATERADFEQLVRERGTGQRLTAPNKTEDKD
jgi:hypothetical protein